MRKNQSVTHVRRRRVMRAVTASVTALAALLLLVASLAWTYQPAAAQGNGAGALSLDTVPDFSVCVALPGVVPQPGLTNTIVSSANGGEIRLRATVEDYFDGSDIDATQWITGASNPAAYPNEAPIVGSGVLTLYGSYLRSQTVFTSTLSPRFFDARVQFVGGGLPSPTNGDIGFYRALPPLLVPPGDESSIRLFISQPFNSTNNRLMYVRSRDGTSVPMIDSLVDNWTDDEATQRIGLSVFRNYRIDWGLTETWYSIDGSTIITAGAGDNPLPHTGVTTRTTYVFLYNQDPESQSPDPILIDWVRAGVYPASGEYVSCIQDAGQIANWAQATVTATLPASTGVQLATRTSVDGVTWSAWADAAGSVISGTATLTPASPSGRYLQYRLTLTSSDPLNSPEVGALTFSHFGPASLVVAPAATTLNPAASQQFTATVRDLNNTVIAGAPVTWAVGSGGVIDGDGLFTAGLPAGVFTATVRATTSNNISNTATVTVRDLPPVANAGGPYTGLEGQTVNLAASASDPNGGPILAYDWDLDNDGQFDDATGATTTASWGDEGVYTIGVRATDSGNLTGTATATVTISNVTPQITSVTNGSPVRRSQPVTVTVTATDVSVDALTYSFDWMSDGEFDIIDQVDNSAATSYPDTGVYTVTVRVRDGDGGAATATTVITVTPQVVSVTAANDGPVRRSQPATVTVAATQELSDALLYSFDWNNDGFYEIENQVSNSAVISYPTTGAKVVRVRVTDADGGAATNTTTVTVTPQVLGVTAANDGPVRRSQPATVTVAATQELSDALLYSFDWNNDGFYEIEDQVSNSAVISYPTTGSRVVGVRVTDPDDGVVTGTTTVVVTPQVLSVTAANNGPVRRAQPATVTATATQELSDDLRYSFDWNNDNTYEIENQVSNSAVISYPATGSQVVRVRVTDADGGVATNTTTVTVTPQVLSVTAANNGSVRRAQPATVTATAGQELSDDLRYAFDWNNDNVYEIENQVANSAVISYPATGPQVVRVRVTDPDGGVATNTTTVTVTPQVLTVAEVVNDGPVGRTQPVTIVVTGTQELGDTLFYAFDWNNDTVYEVGPQPGNTSTMAFALSGAFTVGVRITDTDGGAATGATVVVVQPQTLQIVEVANSTPVIRGQPVTVVVTATQQLSDPLTYSFDWDNDGNYEITDQPANSAVTSYPGTGVKTIGLTVRDASGGVVTGTTTLTVNPQPLQIAGVSNSGPVRRATPVQIVVTATQPLSDVLRYAFDLNNDGAYDVVDQLANSTETSYPNTGVKVVGVRVIDEDGGVVTGTTTVNVTPQLLTVAAVTNSGPVLRGQQVTVIVTATQALSDPLFYSFDWNNDSVYDVVDQPGASAATSYSTVGLKPVGVRVRDADGGVVTGETVISVGAQIIQITAVNSDAPKRRGQPVTVNVVAAQQLNDALRYSFDWNNDGVYDVVDQTASSAATSYATTGVKPIRVRVRDQQNSEASQSATVQIVAQNLALSTVTNSGPVRRGQSVQVTVSAVQELSDALRYSFDWNNDGVYEIENQASNSAAISFPATGSKTVGVRVVDADGGVATGVTTITVTPQTLSVTAANNGPVRRGQSAMVTATASQELSDALRYSFDWNNDGVYEIEHQASNSAATSFPATGSKTVGVRVVDADGGVATGVTTITVTPQTLSLTAANNGTVRRGQSATVSATASQELSDALRYSFDWNNDGVYEIENQTANSAATSFPATGSKTVGVRVVDADGGVATGVTTITVTPQTLTLIGATNSGPVQISASVQVTVEVTQELGDALRYSFDWNNDGVYEIENQASNSAATSFAEAGLKPVAVRVADADGGVVTGTTVIEVNTVGGEGEMRFLYMPIINR